MSSPFCGTCTRDIPAGAYPRYLDGVRICDSCATDALPAVDERHHHGYRAPGGVGVQFMRQVADAHDAIVPREIVDLDAKIVIVPPTEQVADAYPLRFRRDLGRWEP